MPLRASRRFANCAVGSGFRAGDFGAFTQGIAQIDRNAVFLEQIGKCLVRQFLKRRHAVATKRIELAQRIVVQRDQFAGHVSACLLLTASRLGRSAT